MSTAFIAVLIAKLIATISGVDIATAGYLAVVGVVCGHNWPAFLGFRGGKGVATSLGSMIAINPVLALSCFGIFLVIAIGLTFFGFSKVKVDDFKKAAVILLVDSSASNQKNLPAEKMVIRQLCSMLDPEDNIKILRVSEDSYLIYEGSPQSSAEVRKSMEKFTQINSKEYGTAYGLSLKKAFKYFSFLICLR